MSSNSQTVSNLVSQFVESRKEAKTIRTIWYQIKHNLQHLQGAKTEGDFSKSMNKLIGASLWKMFINGQTFIYSSLGIATKAIQLEGRMPVLLFCEKDLGMYDFISRELNGMTYLSSGQIPSFEVALIAERLIQAGKEDVYIVTANDFDVAGFQISASLIDRLQIALDSLGSEIIVHHLPVEVENLDRFSSYTQSNGVQGWELDAIPSSVMKKAVIKTLDGIPRELYRDLGFARWRNFEYQALRLEDDEIHRLQDLISDREESIRAQVEAIPLELDTDFRFDSVGRVRKQVNRVEG